MIAGRLTRGVFRPERVNAPAALKLPGRPDGGSLRDQSANALVGSGF